MKEDSLPCSFSYQ